MVGRILVAALFGLVCASAVVGALILPWEVVFGRLVLGTGAGLLVAFGAPRLPWRRAGPDLLAGVTTAAVVVTACLAVAGLLAAVGGSLTAIVLVLLVAVGLWAGYRRFAAPAVVAPRRVPATLPASRAPVTDLTTAELCVAWRRSYLLLLVATEGPACRLVVQRRQELLDELERRDRSGFLRWLDSGAEAGSDPAPYLTARS
ncbi:hypothetical protein [Amycolatopsis sp. MEPSY49]|uniref:hypothetical protein n=1 Tax=Amycolatopsis sp. MEPSY49 TaxID=3151600 RepID=UPI003EF67852